MAVGTEAGAGAREVGMGEVATEEGVRVVAGVPVAHRRVSPGGAMAMEVAGLEKAVAEIRTFVGLGQVFWNILTIFLPIPLHQGVSKLAVPPQHLALPSWLHQKSLQDFLEQHHARNTHRLASWG